jgi:hypothetical protein
MIGIDETSGIKREDHPNNGNKRKEETGAYGNKVEDKFFLIGQVPLAFSGDRRDLELETGLFDDVLMLGPGLIIVARLLLELEPSRLIFPAGDEINTPDHDK